MEYFWSSEDLTFVNFPVGNKTTYSWNGTFEQKSPQGFQTITLSFSIAFKARQG